MILVSNGDANEELAFDATAAVSSRGSYGIDSAGATRRGDARRALGAGAAATLPLPTLAVDVGAATPRR